MAWEAADAGSGALKRFHVAGMIVRLDFEARHQAAANIHHTGFFARSLYHNFSARRKPLEMHFAGFIRAGFAPHHAENSRLGDVRFAAENLLYSRVFVS